MISIIIASSNEAQSIGKAIRSITDPKYTGYSGAYELIQVSPDDETLSAGQEAADSINLDEKYIQIKDPKKGKSNALNMALKIAQGDIIVMSDGDVFFAKNALSELLKPFSNKSVGGVSGRPRSLNEKSSFWGYISHLLTDAADAKRREVFSEEENGFYISKGGYFPMSGYILAFRNVGLEYDSNFIDDALISLKILKSGHELAYAPSAEVNVRFPTTLSDYLLQRRRNFSGNRDIHKDDRFIQEKDPRSFGNELKYASFPIQYARGIKELFWSLLLYPIRLLTWFLAILPKKSVKNLFWQPVSSTKE